MAQGVFSPPLVLSSSAFQATSNKQQATSNQHTNHLPPKTEDSFLYALSSNNAWAGYKAHQNPTFFPKLASGQSPQIRTSPLCSSPLPNNTNTA